MRMRNLVAAIAVGAWMPALAVGQTSVFRAAYTASGEANPTGMGVGDFDNDGTLDVVTCNSGTANQLNVLIGFNDGTLSEVGPSIPLNSFPSGLLQAKIDSDDIDDLIVAKANDNAVVFVKGLATPDFFDQPGPPITVGQSPIAMASADLDGNHTPDLIVVNEGGDTSPGSISVLLGHGDGTFTLQIQPDPSKPGETVDSLPADLGTRAVAIGNLDADPGLDVLALNARSSSISVYTSDGHGIFTPRGTLPTGAAPQDLALVDLNGDGKLDLIVATSNDDAVTVQLGNGDRTFAAAVPHLVGTAPNRIQLGDVDHDGKLDIVATNSRSGDLSVLLGDGHGGFAAARTYVADAEPQVLRLGDFNNDGLIEPAAATQGSDGGPSVAVLVNRGQGILHGVEDIRVAGGPAAIAVADLNGDGFADMLVSADNGQVEIFPGGANGLGEPTMLNIGGRPLGVAAADLNGDARPDIVVVDTMNNRVAVSLSQGGGRFGPAALYSTAVGPGSVSIGDFNGDGRPDIAVTAIGADRFCQGGPQPGKSCGQDSDCAPDGTCTAPGKASILLQQSNGTFGPARNTTVEETPIGIATIDANCDGKDDLLIANEASSTVSVLRSNGDGTFSIPQTLPQGQVGQNPIALAVADFDRDGTPDFVVTNTVAPLGASNVHLFRGSCSGPFTAFANGQVHVGELASAIVARDFTGDQIVDLALVSQTSNAVYLLKGVGDGTVLAFNSDSVSRMPIAVAAGDFDGDGRYDAVTANNDPSANNLSVLFNCARDLIKNGAPANCDPFGRNGPTGKAALRGDANGDGVRSAADLVAVAAEVMDGDGFQVEAIDAQRPGETTPGVDANGDGRVDAQDRLAVAHHIFGGG